MIEDWDLILKKADLTPSSDQTRTENAGKSPLSIRDA